MDKACYVSGVMKIRRMTRAAGVRTKLKRAPKSTKPECRERSFEETQKQIDGLYQLRLESMDAEIQTTDERSGQSPPNGAPFPAPGQVGCLFLNEKAEFSGANASPPIALDTRESDLTAGSPDSFLATPDRNVFLSHLDRVFESKWPQACGARPTARHVIDSRSSRENVPAGDPDIACSCRISEAGIAGHTRAKIPPTNGPCLFAELLDSIPNPVFYRDFMGVFRGCNRAYAQYLGLSKEEIVGKTVHEIFTKDLADKYHDMDQALFMKPGIQEYEFLARDCRGDQRNVVFRQATVSHADGGSAGLVGIMTDITDRKLLEKGLRQAQKMEALGTLAGGIAHDFNNILSPIIGYTEMALIEMPEADTLRANLRHVLVAANRAKHLVKQILALATVTEQAPKPVQISSIIAETVSFLKASLPSTIEIRETVTPGARSATVWADSTQIFQVLMNLCTNAVQAMTEKCGVLEVSLATLDFKPETACEYADMKPGQWLRLSVADTGHGMSETTLQRIFDPYFTTKPQGEGTGLGLTVVYGIVRNHGGTVSVWSVPDKGTTFHIFLPMYEGQAMTETEISLPLHRGRGRILVVDDEEAMVEIQRCMLEQLGYEVVARLRSIDALETFRIRPDMFELVITDHTMPQLTGVELAEELLRIRSDIPVIVCTGFSEQIDDAFVRERGVKALLMKPFGILELANVVYNVLNEI